MNEPSRPRRRSCRDAEAIAFARDQRSRRNEFANAVWQMVRNRRCGNQKFRREYPIPPYTADFCCVALKLIIEVDGEHHQTEEVARMMIGVTSIWPKEDSPCCGFRDTKSCGIRLVCGV